MSNLSPPRIVLALNCPLLDAEFPSECCEHVLLPLIKEAASGYIRAEYSQAIRIYRKSILIQRDTIEPPKETDPPGNLPVKHESCGKIQNNKNELIQDVKVSW